MNYLTCSYELSRVDIILFSYTNFQKIDTRREKKIKVQWLYDKDKTE